MHVLRLGEAPGGIWPSATACLAVFVSLFGSRIAVLWACFALGLLLDLCSSEPAGGESITVIGPHALGFVAGSILVLQLRTMVFRRRAMTLGFLTLLFALAVDVVAILIFVIRGWFPDLAVTWAQTSAGSELLRRLLMAIYSGIVAIPLGWLLLQTLPLWAFSTHIARSAMRRS
jgi:hypothetical protein